MSIADTEVLTFDELSHKVGPIVFNRYNDNIWVSKAPFVVINVLNGLKYRCRAVSLEGESVYSLQVNRVDTEDKPRNPRFWLNLSQFVLPD